jgi:lipoprotein-anchoring transpeptidase ErfK/SrfK
VTRLALLATALLLALAGAASFGSAATDGCAVATRAEGPAPLAVTFSTVCPAATYQWDFGDGGGADGPSATHTFAAGTAVVTLTRTQEDGSAATDTVTVTADGIALSRPRLTGFGDLTAFHGSVRASSRPASVTLTAGTHALAHARVRPDGTFAVTAHVFGPGPYRVMGGALTSNPVRVVVRPRLLLRVTGSPLPGGRLVVDARVAPRGSGRVALTIRNGTRTVRRGAGRTTVHLTLAPKVAAVYKMTAVVKPIAGWAAARRTVVVPVANPDLALGAQGPAVHALEERLAELHYALERVDSTFDQDTFDAVVAFQKVNGLARTGAVTATDWRTLLRAGIPHVQTSGDAIEVDKTRQVLFVVRNGEAQLVIPVSTGATGNTPLGEFHVYRKVAGWDWVLYFPSYFLRGFAVHGYPSVPAYPASHGCVRIPIWVAQRIYALISFGSRIVIHL